MWFALALCAGLVRGDDQAPGCPDVTCVMFCTNGVKKDSDGCDICSCAEVSGGMAQGDFAQDSHNCVEGAGFGWCAAMNMCMNPSVGTCPGGVQFQSPGAHAQPQPQPQQLSTQWPSAQFGTQASANSQFSFPGSSGAVTQPQQWTGAVGGSLGTPATQPQLWTGGSIGTTTQPQLWTGAVGGSFETTTTQPQWGSSFGTPTTVTQPQLQLWTPAQTQPSQFQPQIPQRTPPQIQQPQRMPQQQQSSVSQLDAQFGCQKSMGFFWCAAMKKCLPPSQCGTAVTPAVSATQVSVQGQVTTSVQGQVTTTESIKSLTCKYKSCSSCRSHQCAWHITGQCLPTCRTDGTCLSAAARCPAKKHLATSSTIPTATR